MSSDVSLIIFDPRSRTVVAERWLGKRGTIEALRAELVRPPDIQQLGFESWGRVTAREAKVVAEARYGGGATPEEVERLSKQFPDDEYWWIFEHEF